MSKQKYHSRVTILGSGTCVPSLDRSSCSLLWQSDASKVLFDSGPGTIHRLLQAGVTIFELTHVCYSHFHPDHSAELVPLLFATKYPNAARRRFPLCLCAGNGFKQFYAGLQAVFGSWIELPPAQWSLLELKGSGPDTLTFEDFTLNSLPVDHNPESLAYRLSDAQGHHLVYSGDSDYCRNLVDIARNADLFVCEAALPDESKVTGHLTPSAAGEIAARAGVKHLVLTHFYPECDRVDIEGQCRKTWKGPLTLAEDLMTIDLDGAGEPTGP
jgi:ribonuclease BN (tRNA processing enzyme)